MEERSLEPLEDSEEFSKFQKRWHKDVNVFVSKDYMKFHAAHFIAYNGYRERLHGHNYRVGVKLWGQVQENGYVVDFTVIKQSVKVICKELNDHVLLPVNSDCLQFSQVDENVKVACQDGTYFSFPKGDCCLLPIGHSSAEELAEYIGWRVVKKFGTEFLLKERQITSMEISVSEAEHQCATHVTDFTKPTFYAKKQKVAAPCPALP